MPNLLIQNISQIASPKPGVCRGPELRSLNIYENAAIYISDGMIKAVGPISEVMEQVEGHPVILDAE
ncbi:MAG TPA: imidazolonepropionase, partial [Balneolaceae bacterium]|nr:imidazolonepropionase [Balneolaceae bacterium]